MRKIISALAVIAVVSCLFAFKENPLSGRYCGSSTANTNCHVIPLKKEVTGATNFFINSAWDGCTDNCISTNCSTAIRLVDQN